MLLLLVMVSSGLNFTSLALQSSHANKAEELSVSFNKSYDGTLKKYHSFVVKPIFAVYILRHLSCFSTLSAVGD